MTEFETRLLRMMEVLVVRQGCDLPDPPVSRDQTNTLLVPNYWCFDDGKILIGAGSAGLNVVVEMTPEVCLPPLPRLGGCAPGTWLMPCPRVTVTRRGSTRRRDGPDGLLRSPEYAVKIAAIEEALRPKERQ